MSYETIYQHIGPNKKSGGHLFQYLRRKGKAYQSCSKHKEAGRGFIKSRISNDDRPHVVDDKSRMGYWQRPQWRTG
jgi:IS30 family transposase